MKILKFYCYLFFQLNKKYEHWHAVLIFNALLISHYFSIIAYYTSANHIKSLNFSLLSYTNNYFNDRLNIAITFILPVFLITYIISKLFKKKIVEFNKEFEEDYLKRTSTTNKLVIMYYIISFLFFFSALISPLFYKNW